MKVIVLAAGQATQLDGFNKLLIKHPKTRKTIIETLSESFSGMEMTLVLGYRAINVMHEYPFLNYIYNHDGAISNSSYSLSIAMEEYEPCFVVSGDLFISKDLVKSMMDGPENLVATLQNESRSLNALNVSHENNQINDIYQGKLRDTSDPEAVGIYKISSRNLLKRWKQNCSKYTNLFIGQNLIIDNDEEIFMHDINGFEFSEINTPEDFIRLTDNAN